MVDNRLRWFYKHWKKFKIISLVVSGLWALHMFWWGATQHIPGQSAWYTADAACDNALHAGFMLWLGLWFCWFGAGMTALAIEKGLTLGERVRVFALAFSIAGVMIGSIVGLVASVIWTTGYAAPVIP